ncbi:MAG: serine protease Do [Kiritimatiellia bacterium]|jgi:serine protease Do
MRTLMKNPLCILALPLLAVLISSTSFGATLQDMKNMEQQVQSLVKHALPATVSVLAQNFAGSGSGVIVSDDGYVLTAAHVVGNASAMDLLFPDGTRKTATVLSANFPRDIALMKIDQEGVYPFVEIGDSRKLELTNIVIALGHPGGFDARRSPPIRIGRVYVPGEDRFIITDCTLVGGDSGGPLFNLAGEVIGIHSSIGGSLASNNHAPTHAAMDHWEEMKAGNNIGRNGFATWDPDSPVIGVELRNEDGHVVATRVSPDSPADQAGLEDEDIILKINNRTVSEFEGFIRQINSKKPGQKVKLKVKRGDETLEIAVKLGRRGDIFGETPPGFEPEASPQPEREPSTQAGFLGALFIDEDGQATVTDVIENTAAEQAGLKAGDKIWKVNGHLVGTVEDLRSAMGSQQAGDQVALEIERNGKRKTVEATLGERPEAFR